MRTVLDSIKTLQTWQAVVLVVVLLGAGAVVYVVYELRAGSGGLGLEENQQLIPVQLGTLTNQVSVNGSIEFPERKTLTFSSSGTIGEVFVDEGQSVKKNEDLAVLDAATIVSLEKGVALARVNLKNAEEALEKAKDPYTGLELADAEGAVSNARLSLDEAQEELDRLLNPTTQEMAKAEATVTEAKLALRDVEDALTELKGTASNSEDGDVAQTAVKVTDAMLSVQDAQEALDEAQNGPSPGDIADAQSRIDSAVIAMENAGRDLTLTERDWTEKLDASRESLDSKVEVYHDVFDKWLGLDPDIVKRDTEPDALLASLDIDLESLFVGASVPLDPPGFPEVLGDDPATPWNEFVVYAWTYLDPEVVYVSCDEAKVAAGSSCIKNELDDAWSDLETASQNLDTIDTQAAKAFSNAEAAITRAEEDLVDAEQGMADLVVDPEPLDIQSKETQLSVALSELQDAEEELSELLDGPDSLEVEAAEKRVAVAEAALGEADEGLAELMDGPDSLKVAAAEKLVAIRQAHLDRAEEDLIEIRRGADPRDVALAEAEAESVRVALDDAILLLDGAVLRAPMAWIVTLVNVEAGDLVDSRTEIAEVVDRTVVEVDGVVDEIDVLFVQQGASAQVTLDALPGLVLEGIVSAIDSAGQNQQGVVTYPISIQVQLLPGVELVEGLSATARVVLSEDANVILVPSQAIYGTFQQPLVWVTNGGGLEERPVTLGNSDGFWTVVLAGLEEGDRVAIQTTEATEDPFAQIRQRIQAGGFGGGGGGGSIGGGGRGGLGAGGGGGNR